MAESSVIKVDPVRLAGLQAYLGELADRCQRAAGSIDDDLVGTGESAAGEIAALVRITAWCRAQHEDVSRRRVFLERLPSTLPLTDLTFTARSEAIDDANRVARRFRHLFDDDPPRWRSLQSFLAEVARGTHSPTFSAQLLRRLGPRCSRDLPVLVQKSWAASGGGASDAHDTAEHGIVRVLLASGLSLEGEHALSARWAKSFAGLTGADRPKDGWQVNEEIRDLLEEAGYAKDIALNLSRAFRAGRLGATVMRGPTVLGVFGLIGDAVDIAEDPSVVNVLDGAAGLLSVLAPVTGPAAPFVFGASAMLTFLAWCERHKQPGTGRGTRRYNPGTGRTEYPSGSQWNPNVDGAGVPLPP